VSCNIDFNVISNFLNVDDNGDEESIEKAGKREGDAVCFILSCLYVVKPTNIVNK
jgi:hypothetical protein